jgi:hypothetical protein
MQPIHASCASQFGTNMLSASFSLYTKYVAELTKPTSIGAFRSVRPLTRVGSHVDPEHSWLYAVA